MNALHITPTIRYTVLNLWGSKWYIANLEKKPHKPHEPIEIIKSVNPYDVKLNPKVASSIDNIATPEIAHIIPTSWNFLGRSLMKIIDKTTGIITKVEPAGTSKLNGINVRPIRNVVIPIISKKPANIG